MNFKIWKEDRHLYFKLLHKRLKDMKIRNKILVFLLITTVFTCLAIGLWSYRISRRSVIENSEVMTMNLLKQVGFNLDERINSFRDTSYRILQTSSISALISYSPEEAQKNKIKSDSALSTVVIQQSSLYSYTKFAFLRSGNGVVTEYYKAREKKKTKEEENQILDQLQSQVTVSRPINWIAYGDEIFFVRNIIDASGTSQGIMCFSVTDKFFEFIGTSQKYLTNDSIVILNGDNVILKNRMNGMPDSRIYEISDYKLSSYYVYTMKADIHGEDYSVITLKTIDNGWTIISLIPYNVLLKGVNQILRSMALVICGVMFLVVLITVVISSTITQNIRVIVEGMKKYEAGNFDARIKPVSYDEIGKLAMQFNYMGLQISNLILMLEKKEKEKRESEYQTLQAQINPHFLYNTLGSLKWSAYSKKEYETADTIDALIRLLRFTIKRAGAMLKLKEEIEYVKNYVAIQRLRYGSAFKIRYEVEESILDKEIPGFLLQPFVENALLHGLDLSSGDGEIVIRAYVDQSFLFLEVQDNGVGMSQERAKEVLAEPEVGEEAKKYSGFNSIGIKIVDKRLRSCYGDEYRTVIESQENQGTLIRLCIPEI